MQESLRAYRCACIRMYVQYVWVCACMFVCMYVCLNRHINQEVCICACMYVCVCMCVCVRMYVCLHVYLVGLCTPVCMWRGAELNQGFLFTGPVIVCCNTSKSIT